MRTCFTMLSLALGLASVLTQPASAQSSGVVFVGDMQSVDQALLDAAELPLPSVKPQPSSRSFVPHKASQPNRQARQTASLPQAAPAMVTPAGFNKAVTAKPTSKPASKDKPSFLARMKPKWLFGEASKKDAAPKDPFASATQQARIELTGAATKARAGVKPIPSFVEPKQATAKAGYRKQAPATLKPSMPTPKRGGGIVQRSTPTPRRGILNWFTDGNAAPAGSTPALMEARKSNLGLAQASSSHPRQSLSQTKPGSMPKAMRSPQQIKSQAAPMPLAKAPAPKPVAPKPLVAKSLPKAKVDVVTDLPVNEPIGTAVFASDDPATAVASVAVPASTSKKIVANASVALPEAPKPPKLVPAYVEEVAAPKAPEKPLFVASAPKPVAKTTPAAPQKLPVVEETTDTPETAKTFVTDDHSMVANAYPIASDAEVSDEPYFATDRFERIETAPKTTTTEPTQRSIDLLAEAHQIAAYAGSSDEFSQVVKHCRYVMAIDESQQAQAYAKQLAGWALTKRGDCFDDEGRHDEAEIDYREALRCDIECWRAEHALGVLSSRKGNVAEAQRHFDRTIDLNPEFAKAYANRAALAVHRGDYHRALDDFQTAIEIDPDLTIAHTGRGRVCHMLGMLDEGLRHLDAAEILEPDDALIASGRADLLVDLGRYGQAAEAYDRAIRLDPNSPAPYRNLAWMQATCPVESLRNGKSALANAEQAERLSGGVDDLTLDTKAAALAAMGRFDEASKVQRQAMDLAPPADAAAYAERLAMYEQGEAFTTRPIAVRQAAYQSTTGGTY